MRPRAGIDLDGCLYQWDASARDLLARKTGVFLPESTHYDALEEAVGPEVWKWLWEPERVVEMFSTGAAYGDGVAAVRSLAETHELIIITKRPRAARIATIEWIATQRIPAREIHMIGSGEKKSLIPCDWYVDDSPAIVEDLATAGKRVYVLDRPWNQKCEFGIRVKSWYDLLTVVNK